MKILIIQENGRHDDNRNYRECFCLQRGFNKLGIQSVVWGLGHDNFNQSIDFNEYDLIINLENYGIGWEPDLSKTNTKKILWSIDSHVRGEEPFLKEFYRSGYNILLHSTKDFVNDKFKIWFPNAFDDTLIFPKNIEKKYDVGFCGSLLNRQYYINLLNQNFNFIHHNFVIGDEMVNSINTYRIHWNRNISNDINYRSFETIGCGVPLITNYNYQYEELGFINGENVLLYKNDTEMINLIKNLLQDEEMINYISKNALALSKKHTYFERTKSILEIYNNLN
jgi:spore maturation protein CgeB